MSFHMLWLSMQEENISVFSFSGVCVCWGVGGGGEGGVCRVLKEISRAKQLQYHTEEF